MGPSEGCAVLLIKMGFTPARSVDEHREVRRYFTRTMGCGAGLVTRRHGTAWLNLRWGSMAAVGQACRRTGAGSSAGEPSRVAMTQRPPAARDEDLDRDPAIYPTHRYNPPRASQ
jgi:hypothetical protein